MSKEIKTRNIYVSNVPESLIVKARQNFKRLPDIDPDETVTISGVIRAGLAILAGYSGDEIIRLSRNTNRKEVKNRGLTAREEPKSYS